MNVDAREDVWPGPFMVDELAVGCAAEVTRLVGLIAQERGLPAGEVSIDARNAAATFKSETLVSSVGWEIPPVWDPLAGDYEASDGWVRLHTNYPHHRAAALAALECPEGSDRRAVEAAVARLTRDDVEGRVVAAGGAAAACRSRDEWTASGPGQAASSAALLDVKGVTGAADRDCLRPGVLRPLEGVRVLDLTRVLAGPTATGVLAAWGADVVRIDPPGFAEMGALLPTTTAGKRCIGLDLRSSADRAVVDELLAGADVIVHGYRPGALARLGLELSDPHPGRVHVTLNAYGWSGEWSHRRGFDSLVQHSTGLTSVDRDGRAVDGERRWRPTPLPCQALDHGAGWLMAAAALSGLLLRHRHGVGTAWRTSLVAVAELLWRLPQRTESTADVPTPSSLVNLETIVPTAWGDLRRIRLPGRIGELAPEIGAAGPVGVVPAGLGGAAQAGPQNGRWSA